jgi:acetyltransferase-like isoleucine patch superfamily enzyme
MKLLKFFYKILYYLLLKSNLNLHLQNASPTTVGTRLIEGILTPNNFQAGEGSNLIIPKNSKLIFGKNVYIGRYVEIGPSPLISIGDYTSIQDRCIIIGEVQIGRYCTFAPNIFISSGKHYFDLKPYLNIKDQDSYVVDTPELMEKHNKKVTIEDDCWIGINVYIAAGIIIGKGSIIGANSVVLKDVLPYSIVAGIPARLINKRLNFNLPKKIRWDKETDFPYFYDGFLISENERKANINQNGLVTKSNFTIALDVSQSKKIILKARAITSKEVQLIYSNEIVVVGHEPSDIIFNIATDKNLFFRLNENFEECLVIQEARVE